MTATMPSSRLMVTMAGIALQNPILLAAGTAGYGRELDDVLRLDSLGGLITKAVSLEPRAGAPAPRVSEFPGGMLNAVGLANPGVDVVASTHLPWLAAHLHRAKVLLNVVGDSVADFAKVIDRLASVPGVHGFELNLSCPNVRAGGLEFGADRRTIDEVVRLARQATHLPVFVKLSPTLPEIDKTAAAALEAGADGISVVNTLPGLLIDTDLRRPVLGFGSGGVSGPALLPVGIFAAYKVFQATGAPIIGVGGVTSAHDVLQYLIAGAGAVAIGTAAMRDPRLPERIITDLASWCEVRGVESISTLTGSLEWQP